jgi:uridine kinase
MLNAYVILRLILIIWLDVFHGGKMWFEQIQRIAKLAQVRYQQGKLLIIAVDGCGGAGKSTLCHALAAKIEPWANSQVLTLDEFYRPISAIQRSQLQQLQARAAYFNVEAFKHNVLSPLHGGLGASYKPFHWLDGEQDQAVELLPTGVLIVDGVFSFSKPLRDLIHLSIFVDTSLPVRKQRLLARPQLDSQWVSHWQATESWHHQHEHTSTAVDFVLSGTQG